MQNKKRRRIKVVVKGVKELFAILFVFILLLVAAYFILSLVEKHIGRNGNSRKNTVITTNITTETTTEASTTSTTVTTETTTEATTEAIYNMSYNGSEGDYLGKFRVTVYCPCDECNGKWAEWGSHGWQTRTKLGPIAVSDHTIAVDPGVIPLGTEVLIEGCNATDGVTFVAEDTGSAINGNHIDLYVDDHNDWLWWNNPYLDVYTVS